MVVLTNPNRYPVPLGDDDVRMALHGDPVVTFPVHRPEQARVEYGRHGVVRPADGRDRGMHAYVSAVAVLEERPFEVEWDEDRRRIGFGPPPSSIPDAAAGFVSFVERIEREKAAADIPAGTYLSLSVFETVSVRTGEAEALPDDLFDAAGDRRLSFDDADRPVVVRGRNVSELFVQARRNH